MQRVWKLSVLLLAVQMVAGGIAWGVTGDGTNGLIAALLVLIIPAQRYTPDGWQGIVWAIGAFMAFVTFIWTLTWTRYGPLDTPSFFAAISSGALIITAIAWQMATSAVREWGAKERHTTLYITALPLGIGVIVGGLLLFCKSRWPREITL